ncbi:MAG: IS4 family transposase [Planctomycetota bacterium]
MLLLVVGIYKARSIHLSLIARQVPIRVRKLSLERRLRRFMDNGAIRVRDWYRPMAVALLRAASSGGQVHLLIDSTKVSARHQLVMVAVAYRRRALPLAWTWIRTKTGHSTVHKQVALLTYVHSLVSDGIHVSLAGDGEFGNVGLLRQLDDWGWDYALRLKGTRRFWPYQARHLYRLDRQKLKPGSMLWLGRVNLTASNPYITNLVLYRARGEPDPWYLATNLPGPHGALQLYRRRMWIEEMFGDMKGHGFNLEATRLGTFLRLSRLTLAVCLVYLWLVATGEQVLNKELADEVDRTDRRSLSIFRIGWDFTERCLALDDPIPIAFVPLFGKVSGC